MVCVFELTGVKMKCAELEYDLSRITLHLLDYI